MLQTVQGKKVFVVDFTELPELPITDDGAPELKLYAEALDDAIRTGLISKPGKYGIQIFPLIKRYEIYEIQD